MLHIKKVPGTYHTHTVPGTFYIPHDLCISACHEINAWQWQMSTSLVPKSQKNSLNVPYVYSPDDFFTLRATSASNLQINFSGSLHTYLMPQSAVTGAIWFIRWWKVESCMSEPGNNGSMWHFFLCVKDKNAKSVRREACYTFPSLEREGEWRQ